MLEATTGVLDAYASVRTMPKLSPPSDGAQSTSASPSRRHFSSSVTRPAISTPSDTAMRALSFEKRGGAPATLAVKVPTSQLVEYVWKVATVGCRAASVAYQLAYGAFGSCTWTTSYPPVLSSLPRMPTVSGKTPRFDTAPFIGRPIVRPSGIR